MQENMQENLKSKIPTTEILSFLVAARYECINSVLLEDFDQKIAILKEQPMFSQLLSDFNKKTTRVAIRLLNDLDRVSIYHHHNSIEFQLSHPAEQTEIWNNRTSIEEQFLYLQMAQTYRKIEIDLNKMPKVKRNS